MIRNLACVFPSSNRHLRVGSIRSHIQDAGSSASKHFLPSHGFSGSKLKNDIRTERKTHAFFTMQCSNQPINRTWWYLGCFRKPQQFFLPFFVPKIAAVLRSSLTFSLTSFRGRGPGLWCTTTCPKSQRLPFQHPMSEAKKTQGSRWLRPFKGFIPCRSLRLNRVCISTRRMAAGTNKFNKKTASATNPNGNKIKQRIK